MTTQSYNGLSPEEMAQLEELMSTVMTEWPPALNDYLAIQKAKDRGFINGEWYVHYVSEWIKTQRS